MPIKYGKEKRTASLGLPCIIQPLTGLEGVKQDMIKTCITGLIDYDKLTQNIFHDMITAISAFDSAPVNLVAENLHTQDNISTYFQLDTLKKMSERLVKQ